MANLYQLVGKKVAWKETAKHLQLLMLSDAADNQTKRQTEEIPNEGKIIEFLPVWYLTLKLYGLLTGYPDRIFFSVFLGKSLSSLRQLFVYG